MMFRRHGRGARRRGQRIAAMPAEPEKTAALTSTDPIPAETATPDTPAKPEAQAAETKTAEIKAPEIEASEIKTSEIKVLDVPTPTERAPAPADAAAPVAVAETKIATAEQVSPPANESAPAVSDPASATSAPDPAITSTKVATLGGPVVTIEPPAAKAGQRRRQHQEARAGAARDPAAPWRTAQGWRNKPFSSRPTRFRRNRLVTKPRVADQAGPVATGGPSGRPHSDHEPS